MPEIRENIIIHYDVDNHNIDILTVAKNLTEIEKILKNIILISINNISSDDIHITLNIEEKGGYKQIISVLSICGALMYFFTDNPSGKSFIKGLTGHFPEYYTGELGKFISTAFTNFMIRDKYNENFNLDNHKIKTSIIAKSKFYSNNKNSSTVKGVNFDHSHNFITNFDDYILDDIQSESEVELDLKVLTSQLNENKDNNWVGLLIDDNLHQAKKISFKFHDKYFFETLQSGELKISSKTYLKGIFNKLVIKNTAGKLTSQYELINVKEFYEKQDDIQETVQQNTGE